MNSIEKVLKPWFAARLWNIETKVCTTVLQNVPESRAGIAELPFRGQRRLQSKVRVDAPSQAEFYT